MKERKSHSNKHVTNVWQEQSKRVKVMRAAAAKELPALAGSGTLNDCYKLYQQTVEEYIDGQTTRSRNSSVSQEKSRVWVRQRAARAQLHSLCWLFILNRKHLLDNGLALRLQMNYGHPFTTWRLVINFDINFPVSSGL